MNQSVTPSDPPDAAALLAVLTRLRPALSPELKKAAGWILDHPADLGLSSIRELAKAAEVKPNTLVRLARELGVDGFDELRQPFRERLQRQPISFSERARDLQLKLADGEDDSLVGSIGAAQLQNLQSLYRALPASDIREAARAILTARTTWVLGVGVANPIARNFAYLASMAVDSVRALPRDGSLPIDGLARADGRDLLIAMTFKPFRREVIDAVEMAHQHGVPIIGISDSLACPVLSHARQRFIVPAETPQFFTSTVAISAFFELLSAFVIAEAGSEALTNIEAWHRRRHELGIYLEEDSRP